jgi:hypothetical protein
MFRVVRNHRPQNTNLTPSRVLALGFVFSALASSTAPLYAENKNADDLEAKARQASIERFKDFMQDKNIQTNAQGPDGKKIQGKAKLNANPDDKNPFESDLTYHDRPITKFKLVKDPSKPNDPEATKLEEEKAFVSPHGNISAAGGSSTLERKSAEVDKQFEEQDKKEKKKPEEGTSYDGMFVVETKEVRAKDIQKSKQTAANPDAPINQSQNADEGEDNPEDEFITVARRQIRPEGVKEFQEVGKNAGDTVIQSARDPEQKDNTNALANGVLLRVAAAENLMALWRGTLANLTQRRSNKAIEPLRGDGGKVGRIEMDEETPNCNAWAAKARKEISQIPPDIRKNVEKDLEQMTNQCNQIASMPYNTVNPQYVPDDNNKYQLKIAGPETEDNIERDSRAQLELMARAGKSVTDVDSNWKYDTQDDKVKMNRFQADGSSQEIETTAAEEIDSYNNQLRKAKEGYDEVAKKIGNFQPPDPTQYEIQQEEKSIMEISQAPAAAMEDYGVQGRGSLTETAPESYEQLQNPQE